MTEDIQQVELQGFRNFEYKVDANVILQILDLHYRQNSQQACIVTLMGTIYPTKIEVQNCCKVIQQQQMLIENITKIFPKQNVIGYAISNSLSSISNHNLVQFTHKIHYDSMQKQQSTIGMSPFFLTVDTDIKNGRFQIQGYIDELQEPNMENQLIFYQPVHTKIEIFDQNKAQMINFAQQSAANNQNYIQLDKFKDLLQELTDNVKIIHQYVRNVKDNKIKGDVKIGVALKKIMRDIPQFNQEGFRKQVETYLEDISLIMYLKNLLNLQAVISEKINKI